MTAIQTESQHETGNHQLDYEELVQTDRIHGSLYTSPTTYEDEMDHIWHGGWVYIGHESEVKEPGDYCMRLLGREPIVISRSADGEVNVLLNRCPHRGNRVVNDEYGNSRNFQCAYHAFTFTNKGALIGAPYPQGFVKSFDKSELCMAKVPRVESYRGFLFGSLSPTGISIDEHLGNGKLLIDRLCDLAPDGEIEIKAGSLKHRMKCNWKMLMENDTDAYHPQFVHGGLFKARTGGRPTPPPTAAQRSRGGVKVRDWGSGHAELDPRPMRGTGRLFGWLPGNAEKDSANFVARLEAKLGKEAAHAALVDGPPHATIFPNLFLGQCNIIVVQPLGVADTIQYTTPLSLKGAPEMDRHILTHTAGGLGPAGLLFADDDEIGERNQLGLVAREPQWLYIGRGLEREEVDSDGSIVSDGSDETSTRSFWKQYRKVMSSNGSVA
jgi:phenylpropionate dioxygenase-like ring-hydroxylating dioxygenase large terminal subunit